MSSALLLVFLIQAAPAPTKPAASAAAASKPLAYRGFSPGMGYRDFSIKARSIAQSKDDILACQTMHHTAQVMDCAVRVKDADSARFYLSANVIEGRTSVISLFDSGGVALLKRTQDDMRRQLGTPQRHERSMWEWSRERRFIRLNWRGSKDWRVVSITLNDRDVMDKIARYRPPASAASPKPK
ncbi:MAG TPA: hypothetical protein VMR92_12640 [Gemmatimonadales bacterium]|nr:hypothetical protein [Gemmatimonadales bacterium]